jgi:pyrroline-5-carboxylate reductase
MNQEKHTLGFIGVGVMAGAILNSTLNYADELNINPNDMYVYDLDDEKTSKYIKSGVNVASSINEIFSQSKTVLIGVKPQQFLSIFDGVVEFNMTTVVSIMAGVKIASIREKLNQNIGIVRVMPNTPCVIGSGMIAMCFDNVEKEVKKKILDIFKCCGQTLILSECKFDAVTSISGSGPAYVYSFIDGLIRGGIEGGLSYEDSKMLATQTIIGATKLAIASDEPMSDLINKVCSKGGTTIEAINYFEDNNFKIMISKAIELCRIKSKELSKLY